MALGSQASGSEVAADVSMLKLTVYGNEHQLGLVTKIDKADERITKVELTNIEAVSQIKGAATALKLVGGFAIGLVTILASIVEIYRAFNK